MTHRGSATPLARVVFQQPVKQDIATDPRSELATNYDELTTPQQDNKRIPIPEHVEPEQKKRGFLSRFFLPYG